MPSVRQMHVWVVFNPGAGGLKSLCWERLAFELARRGWTFEAVTLAGLGKIAQDTTKTGMVLVVGGDGTLHQGLNAIGLAALPRFVLALLPGGTGNDFARSLGMPLNLSEALHALDTGDIQTVDLGVVNQQVCFACAVSLGFGPSVTRRTSRSLRWLLGSRSLYLGALVQMFLPRTIHRLRLRMDQGAWEKIRTLQFVIGNTSTHGGGFPISPSAHLQNGHLDVYYYQPIRFWRLWQIGIKILRHYDHTRFPEVRYRQAQEVQLRLEHPMVVDIDGELYTFQRQIQVQILPGRLQVLCPPVSATLHHKPVEDLPRNLVG